MGRPGALTNASLHVQCTRVADLRMHIQQDSVLNCDFLGVGRSGVHQGAGDLCSEMLPFAGSVVLSSAAAPTSRCSSQAQNLGSCT